MESGVVFGIAISLGLAFLRWRVPAVPKLLATCGIFVSLGVAAWAKFPQFDWQWTAAITVFVAASAVVLDALFFAKDKTDITSAQAQPAASVFVKASNGAEVDIEDSYSSAETFADVQGSKLTARRNWHDPSRKSGSCFFKRR